MKLLALDAASKTASVAVYENGLLGEIYLDQGLTHSETLLPMADALFAQLKILPREIEAVAVTSGPGSFTGLRIGMSTAKGFAEALQIPMAGISTLQALALPLRESGVLIAPILDARRGEVYAALYCGENTILPPCALPLSELIAAIKKRGERVCFCGDGVPVHRETICAQLTEASFAPAAFLHVRAGAVAQLAAERGEFLPAPQVQIEYLRESRAQTLAQRQKDVG